MPKMPLYEALSKNLYFKFNEDGLVFKKYDNEIRICNKANTVVEKHKFDPMETVIASKHLFTKMSSEVECIQWIKETASGGYGCISIQYDVDMNTGEWFWVVKNIHNVQMSYSKEFIEAVNQARESIDA